jgi:hypothetical protein
LREGCDGTFACSAWREPSIITEGANPARQMEARLALF